MRCDEAMVILHYHSRMVQLCKSRWPYIAMDEILSEAHLVMLSTIRTPRIPDGEFWPLFQRSFIRHMEKYCRDAGELRFRNLSLNASLNTKNHTSNWTLLDCLSDPHSFEAYLYLHDFLTSLPQLHRHVLTALTDKMSDAQIASCYGLVPCGVEAIRRRIQNDYILWEGTEDSQQIERNLPSK